MENEQPRRKMTIALVGNANVGKSVVFNQLTGLHQHIGNWPGKTVEKAEGSLVYNGYRIDVVDLPGIYSLSTYSIEELISREYIVINKPDVVVNVIDASVLERNLFFTIQLLELKVPMILAVNQIDLAEKKGITIDYKKLEDELGIPVVPMAAIKGVGIQDILERCIDVIEGRVAFKHRDINYGREIERQIARLQAHIADCKNRHPDIKNICSLSPSRWVALKLLEDDAEVRITAKGIDATLVTVAEQAAKELEKKGDEPSAIQIAAKRYDGANRIANAVQTLTKPRVTLLERIDEVTTHKFWGYPIMAAVLLVLFFSIFTFGDAISGIIGEYADAFMGVLASSVANETLRALLVNGIVDGFIAALIVVIPYIAPFYIVLALLEETGYIARVAFLMDNLMHKIGLHGKAFIPIILGFGCNVPGVLGCRIMETHRERFLAAFVTTLVPCAATSVVILGSVGAFVGAEWALGIYALDIVVIFLLGRLAFRALPGEPMGLIMEMPSYKVPSVTSLAYRTWVSLKGFVVIAFPIIIAGSFILALLDVIGALDVVGAAMSPLMVTWLGFPETVNGVAVASALGIILLFGILRKELLLVLLAAFLGTGNFLDVLSPLNLVVFGIVTMFYIPCISTIAALIREFGWKRALAITAFEILFALALGGIAFRVLSFFGVP